MRIGLAILVLFASGCGARTGLGVEPALFDAGVDPVDAFAPMDAFRPDAPPDASLDAPACTFDADCDDGIECTIDACDRGRCRVRADDGLCEDGLFCNGEERCVPGVGCRAEAPICGDTVACTVDRCDEGRRACVSDPDFALCPISHRCDPVRGCVARALAHDATTLYEIDLPSGTLHVLGPTIVTLTDLALHPDGTLYGAAPGALARIDLAAMTIVNVVAVPGAFNALDVSPEGTLYGATDDRVVRFDLARGTVTTIAQFPPGLHSSGDIAFVEGRLYATTIGLGSDDALVEVELSGGGTRVVGRLGHWCVWGLAPFGTTLHGLTCEGKLLSIDVATGAGVVLSRGTTEFYGAGAR